MERDNPFVTISRTNVYFNSHAHVERDCYIIIIFCHFFISTHTLTWSVTNFLKFSFISIPISTHTLTWSVTSNGKTYAVCEQDFNSHAHVERDKVSSMFVKVYNHFNSHAHVERDNFLKFSFISIPISTHTLTWSVTPFCYHITHKRLFQLTRSRGA